MKRILTVFAFIQFSNISSSFQIFNSCPNNYHATTPRPLTTRRITRTCHFTYNQKNLGKELGNAYFKEAFYTTNQKKALLSQSANPKTRQTAISKNLSDLLIIKSLLPEIHHPVQINSSEILPKH